MKLGNVLAQAGEHIQFVLVCIVVAAAIIAISKAAEKTILKKSVVRISSTKYIAICGMLGALSAVLMLFEIPMVFIAPSFYKLDFSELPVLIGGFFLGPVGAVIIELVKILLKLVMKGTSTAFVGEFANFAVGCALVVPAAIIYHLKKTKTNAVVSMVIGTLIMAVFGALFNGIYLLPAFSALYGMPLDAIVGMGTAINSHITSVSTMVIFSVLPLNLIKGGLVSILTALLYKRISVFLRGMLEGEKAAARKR